MMVKIYRHGKRDTTKIFDSETEKAEIVKYLKNQSKFVWTVLFRNGMLCINIHARSLRKLRERAIKGTDCNYYYSFNYAPVLLGY